MAHICDTDPEANTNPERVTAILQYIKIKNAEEYRYISDLMDIVCQLTLNHWQPEPITEVVLGGKTFPTRTSLDRLRWAISSSFELTNKLWEWARLYQDEDEEPKSRMFSFRPEYSVEDLNLPLKTLTDNATSIQTRSPLGVSFMASGSHHYCTIFNLPGETRRDWESKRRKIGDKLWGALNLSLNLTTLSIDHPWLHENPMFPNFVLYAPKPKETNPPLEQEEVGLKLNYSVSELTRGAHLTSFRLAFLAERHFGYSLRTLFNCWDAKRRAGEDLTHLTNVLRSALIGSMFLTLEFASLKLFMQSNNPAAAVGEQNWLITDLIHIRPYVHTDQVWGNWASTTQYHLFSLSADPSDYVPIRHHGFLPFIRPTVPVFRAYDPNQEAAPGFTITPEWRNQVNEQAWSWVGHLDRLVTLLGMTINEVESPYENWEYIPTQLSNLLKDSEALPLGPAYVLTEKEMDSTIREVGSLFASVLQGIDDPNVYDVGEEGRVRLKEVPHQRTQRPFSGTLGPYLDMRFI
jgi:hypothetical protein